jgi:flagellar basal-body rod protein FlgC
MNTLASSLSGLFAASQHINNSAHNVANIHSTTSMIDGKSKPEPYRPTDIVQSSVASQGGVQTKQVRRDPAVIVRYQPEHPAADDRGLLETPNVDAQQETITQKMATYSFKGNLKAMQAYDEMLGTILDITV